jgi:peptidoglycan/LPS O-acetylase OafA/YrhL
MSSNYRREIDGLRALAVLPVIFFHAGFALFKGGFVGVDIFFVISGYLITTIIVSQLRNQTFNFTQFYLRRARRILPALFVMLLACLPPAYCLMLPHELVDFSVSLLSIMIFSSNIFFYRQSGYFDSSAEQKPLLHTWSLAVEEQYYMIFPVLMTAIWAIRKHVNYRFFISILFLSSLITCEIVTRSSPSAAFYLLPSRAWEILLGTMVAIYSNPNKPIALKTVGTKRFFKELSELLGMLMILGSIVFFDKNTPWPGLAALVPSVGAVMILVLTNKESIVGRFLCSNIMTRTGLISYSAYLWHQPLFAFARLYIKGDIGLGTTTVLLIVLCAISYISWRFIETPCRNSEIFENKGLIRGLIIITIILSLVGLIGVSMNGFRGWYQAADRDLTVPLEERSAYVIGEYESMRSKKMDFSNDPNKFNLLLVGDSFSQDFLNMTLETGVINRFDIYPFYVNPNCQLYENFEEVAQYVTPLHKANCERDLLRKVLEKTKKAEVVVLALSWAHWDVKVLINFISKLNLKPNQTLIVLGRKKFGEIFPQKYIGMTPQERAKIRNTVQREHIQTNDLMRTSIKSDIFVDLHAILCGRMASDCPIFNSAGDLISYDGSHLTKSGAHYVGIRLFEHPLFKKVLSNTKHHQ